MEFRHKKRRITAVVSAGAVMLVLAAGGVAIAYMSASGAGNGAADVGNVTSLTIRQVGAGYDSLLPSTTPNPYKLTECVNSCTGHFEIGDQVTLVTPSTATTAEPWARVTSATVALVNYNTSAVTQKVTLHLTGGPNGAYTFTMSAKLAAAASPENHTVTLVKFTFAGGGVFEYKKTISGHHFTYGIVLTAGTSSGVNIALVDPAHNVSVGTQPTGTVLMTGVSTTNTAGTPLVALTGYIPAVQFNVVGGVVPALYPGSPAQPIQYAVTNPNSGSVHVNTITTKIETTGSAPTSVTHKPGCLVSWFTLASPTYAYNTTVPHGTTIVTTGSTTLALDTSGTTQDACKGATVPLTFSSST